MTIENIAFEFGADRVATKPPAELGKYIAGMSGDLDAKHTLAALAITLLGYDDSQSDQLINGFTTQLEVDSNSPSIDR